MGDENDRLGVLEVPKEAVPVGTAAGFQLAAALKSKVPATGPATVASSSQVASCARAETATAISAEEASSAARRARDRLHRQARTNGSVLWSPFGGRAT